MHIQVLGSAAGGGFPQWNCNCRNCAGLRQGTLKARARTQSSITVSGDGVNWVLFNASPDIRAQLAAFPPLMIEMLHSLKGRKVLIHINNTNPILDENSVERAVLAAEGIEVIFDGMDISL